MVNPLVGHICWPVPDNHTISVTLFKDPRTHELEDKDWAFAIEDVSSPHSNKNTWETYSNCSRDTFFGAGIAYGQKTCTCLSVNQYAKICECRSNAAIIHIESETGVSENQLGRPGIDTQLCLFAGGQSNVKH